MGDARPGAAGPTLPEGSLHDLVDLYREHERRIFALCMRFVANPADAEDLTQETFLRTAHNLDRLNGEAHAYLGAVARNLCLNELRRRRRGQAAATLLETRAVAHADDAAVDRGLLRGAWANLTPSQRALVVDRFAGFSYEEMSQRTGRSVSAISVALTRARERARKLGG
jgi:RNA polymerase sigma-70 factor (ECF subfamily)